MLSVFQCPWNFKNASKHVVSNQGNSASHISRQGKIVYKITLHYNVCLGKK